MVLSFNVQPEQYRTEALRVNGVKQLSENEASIQLPLYKPLEIEIRERFVWRDRIWDGTRALIAAIAFVAALPAFTELIKFWLSRAKPKAHS